MDAIVFDIQRCSMHDGPGIRTTVFLKGCPLRCVWCHNPESQAFRPETGLFVAKCVGCRACEAACPNGAQLFEPRRAIERARCSACGACARVCPASALRVYGEAMSAERIMDEARKDLAYYQNSGGGLTVSGGEPLAQAAFLRRLLTLARRDGIHTCVETSGFAAWEQIDPLTPLVDLWLYDIKAGASDHQRLTGVPLEPILANLDRLLSGGATVLLRCPLVPGQNDTDEHLRQLAALSKRYPQLAGIEILPYHDLGRSKADAIGREYELSAKVDAQVKQDWQRRMREAGLAESVIQTIA